MYNQAHELAKAIKESEEFKTFKELHEKIIVDEKNKKIIEDYHEKAIELQMQMMGGQEPDEEKIEAIRSLESIIAANVTVRNYLEAEMRLSTAYADIQKILSDAIDLPLNPM